MTKPLRKDLESRINKVRFGPNCNARTLADAVMEWLASDKVIEAMAESHHNKSFKFQWHDLCETYKSDASRKRLEMRAAVAALSK